MYAITKTVGNKYWCELTIQDGTERWMAECKEDAIGDMIRSVYAFNHVTISEDDIEFYEEKETFEVTKVKLPKPSLGECIQRIAELTKKYEELEKNYNQLKYRLDSYISWHKNSAHG